MTDNNPYDQFIEQPKDVPAAHSSSPGGNPYAQFVEAPSDATPVPQSEPGFFSKVGQDIGNRWDTYQKQVNDPNIVNPKSENAPLSAGLLAAGQTAGGMGDVIMDTASAITPDWYKKQGQEAFGPIIDKFGKTKAGQAIGSGIGTMAQKYGEFSKEHPSMAAHLGAVGNIGAMALPLPGAGKSVGNAAIDATVAAGKAVPSAVAKGTGAALDGLESLGAKTIGKNIPAIDGDTAMLAKRAMEEYDIPLAHHQVTNSPAMDIAQKNSQDIPWSGMTKFYDNQMKAINKGVARSFGQTGDRITPQLMDRAYRNLGGKFDKMFTGQSIHLTPDDITNIKSVMSDAKSNVGKDAQDIIQQNVNKIFENLEVKKTKPTTTYDPYGPSTTTPSTPSGYTITGEKANQIRTQLQEVLRNKKDAAGEAADPYISKALDKFMDASFDSLPDGSREAYKDLKYRYKNLITATPIAGKAIRGNINPALIEGAVRRTYGDKALATADSTGRSMAGELGDLAKISKTFLPKLGGSDTVQKGTMMGAIAAPLAALATTGPAGAAMTAGAEGLGIMGNRMYQNMNTNQKAVKSFIDKHLPSYVYEDFDGDIPFGEATGGRVESKIGFKLKPKVK